MDVDVATEIVSWAPGETELYEGYSGRGMEGAETAGIHFAEWKELLIAVAEYAYSLDGDEPTKDHLVDEIHRMRIDNMGRGFIAY